MKYKEQRERVIPFFFNIRERKSDKVTKKKSDDNYFIGKVSVSEKKYSIGKTVTWFVV